MKMYNKPEIYVEEFRLNEAISACPTESSYKAVQVSCEIKSGSEWVFASGTNDCNYHASASNMKTIDANSIKGTYNGEYYDFSTGNGYSDFDSKQYFYWYGSSSGMPDDGGVYHDINKDGSITDTDKNNEDFGVLWGKALMNVLRELGVAGETTSGKLHAGVANAEVIKTINSSY